MTVYLDEGQAGCDSSTIGFPHVLLCMAVVVQTGAYLYGLHFDTPPLSNEYAGALLDFMQRKGGNIANGVRLYGCCNHAARDTNRNPPTGNGDRAWKTEMRQIAATLGYHGRVSGFDTAIIAPQNGTYIEFHREQGTNHCRIYYKRHEKMSHNVNTFLPGQRPAVGTGNVSTWRATNAQGRAPTGVWEPNRGQTTSADLAQNATTMHELNYTLRLTTFLVP